MVVSQRDAQVLRERALRILSGNLRQGYDPRFRRRYAYIRPSNYRYPWQWFWDSCFHAIALSHLDLALAKQELLSLVALRRRTGSLVT
ncbi:MAG: hypothetical protein HYY31_00065 [Chloroflexi bacterium]|nr:hypothetical protein [Chloroflexota bacterium]